MHNKVNRLSITDGAQIETATGLQGAAKDQGILPALKCMLSQNCFLTSPLLINFRYKYSLIILYFVILLLHKCLIKTLYFLA